MGDSTVTKVGMRIHTTASMRMKMFVAISTIRSDSDMGIVRQVNQLLNLLEPSESDRNDWGWQVQYGLEGISSAGVTKKPDEDTTFDVPFSLWRILYKRFTEWDRLFLDLPTSNFLLELEALNLKFEGENKNERPKAEESRHVEYKESEG